MMRLKTVGKRLFASCLFLVLLASSLHALGGEYPTFSRSDLKTLQRSFAKLAEDVKPAVVVIRTYVSRSGRVDADRLRTYSQGTGTIFRNDGYIVTNYHVIEDATHVVVVTHDGHKYDVETAHVDPRSDLAVLKIDARNLKTAPFGDLANVRVGHWTFVVGNPFGLSNFDGRTSFTVGNVSAIGKNLTPQLDPTMVNRYYGNLIETSAAINPGNSGGPLFNIDGEVVGIVTAIETRSGASEGLGYAIPISKRTRTIISKLARGEDVRYGYLGVTTTDVTPARDNRPPAGGHSVRGRLVSGALIDQVFSGPAKRAGLRADDIIIELDGTPIEHADHLVRIVGQTPVGVSIKARYMRDGRQHLTTVVLGDRDVELAGTTAPPHGAQP